MSGVFREAAWREPNNAAPVHPLRPGFCAAELFHRLRVNYDAVSFSRPEKTGFSPNRQQSTEKNKIIADFQLSGDFRENGGLAFEIHDFPPGKIIILTEFQRQKSRNGKQKAGFGKASFRDKWLNQFRKNSILETQIPRISTQIFPNSAFPCPN